MGSIEIEYTPYSTILQWHERPSELLQSFVKLHRLRAFFVTRFFGLKDGCTQGRAKRNNGRNDKPSSTSTMLCFKKWPHSE